MFVIFLEHDNPVIHQGCPVVDVYVDLDDAIDAWRASSEYLFAEIWFLSRDLLWAKVVLK